MRARKIVTSVLASGTVAVLAAACGGGSSSGSSSASTSKGGGDAKTVNIGISGILSGPSTFPGFVDGAEAYYKTINAKGGIDGYSVDYYVGDNAEAGPQAVTVARSLVAEHKVLGIIAQGTVPAQAMIPLEPQLKVPMEISADGDLYIPPKPGVYDAIPSYTALWEYVLGAVKAHFNQSAVSYIYQDDAFGQPLSKVVPAQASSHGIQVKAGVPVPDNVTSNFTPYAQRLRASGAPVVLSSLSPQLASGVVKAAQAIGYNPLWISTWDAESPAFVDAVGPTAMKRVYAVDLYPPLATTHSTAVAAYTAAMKKYYPDHLTDQYAYQGWTYAAIFAYAIKQVADAKEPMTAANVNTAISHINGVPIGLLPKIAYSSTGHQGVNVLTLLGYQNGAFHQITPFENLPSVKSAG